MTDWEWVLVGLGAWGIVALCLSLLLGAALGKHWMDGGFEE